VTAGLIVGFDHDDASIFDQQLEFSQEACIPMPTAHMLKAPLGTKLWVRFHKEGRVVHFEETGLRPLNDTRAWTNILPKLMTRQELMTGYLSLVERLRDWRNFETRVMGMLSLIQRQPQVKPRAASWEQSMGVFKFVLEGMEPQARQCAIRLLRHTRQRAPFMVAKVIGLLARQYLEVAELPSLRELIEAQIRLESTEESRLRREPTVFFVPEAFKKPYRDLFPQLHEHVDQGLIDKSRTQDALVEVVYDFLTRWGLTFEQFGEHHRLSSSNLRSHHWKENGGCGWARTAGTPGASRSPRRSERRQTLVWLSAWLMSAAPRQQDLRTLGQNPMPPWKRYK
jgi:hypothetical protein